MKCIDCGTEVTEQEFKDRYDELSKLGIVPMLVPMCKQCREHPRVKTWAEWKLERDRKGY